LIWTTALSTVAAISSRQMSDALLSALLVARSRVLLPPAPLTRSLWVGCPDEKGTEDPKPNFWVASSTDYQRGHWCDRAGPRLLAVAIQHRGEAARRCSRCWSGWVTSTSAAAFNLIPGFPLDGGRSSRHIWWSRKMRAFHSLRLALACRYARVHRAPGFSVLSSSAGAALRWIMYRHSSDGF